MPKIVLFCQSLRSDWNHGNAHFLRGVLSECWHRGFDVLALEPANSWSAQTLLEDHGPAALDAWRDPTRRCHWQSMIRLGSILIGN